jgi:hypothetical protein
VLIDLRGISSADQERRPDRALWVNVANLQLANRPQKNEQGASNLAGFMQNRFKILIGERFGEDFALMGRMLAPQRQTEHSSPMARA